MPTKAANARNIPDSCKEAVAESVLNNLFARVSGKGEFHRTVRNVRPSDLLVSGFLIPCPEEERNSDEEASPLQINSIGLDFHVGSDYLHTPVRLHVKGSAYIRIYPSATELAPGGPLFPRFQIEKHLAADRRTRRAAAREALRHELGVERSRERLHPDWNRRLEETRKKIDAELGIPLNETSKCGYQLSPDEAQSDNAAEEAPPSRDGGHANYGADSVYEAREPPQKWVRIDLELPAFNLSLSEAAEQARRMTAELNYAIAAQLRKWFDQVGSKPDSEHVAYRSGSKILPSHIRDWPAYLRAVCAGDQRPCIPQFDLRWAISTVPDPLKPGREVVHLAIENWTRPPGRAGEAKEQDCSLFQVQISAELATGALQPLLLDRVKPSYRYNEYLRYPALGFNGGITHRVTGAHDVLTSTWNPWYVLPRIEPRDVEAERGFEALSTPSGIGKLAPIVQAYELWLKDAENTPLDVGLSGPGAEAALASEKEKFARDREAWVSECKAIDRGVRLLQESAKHWSGPGPQTNPLGIPCEAWFAMNAAMREVGKGKYDSWRLFQVAFIVSMIPTFASRIPDLQKYMLEEGAASEADAVTLLYFATGGGKSEAFLGLLLFVLLLDRLRGKERGVSALMRYPLRLLTLQQARRTMRVLAQGEIQRVKRNHPGEPLSMGFWVGSSNTPNWRGDPDLNDVPTLNKTPPELEPEVEAKSPYSERRKAWLKLESCPFCGASTALRRAPKREGHILGHYCTAAANTCEWTRRFSESRALPFYIVDEDIYAIAPSVILGTVDKLAVIGQSFKTIRRVFSMFGMAPFRDPSTGHLLTPITRDAWGQAIADGMEPLFPVHDTGTKAFFDPFPTLLIQDEAHLLEESLGTFAGLFESALDAGLNRLAPLLSTQICIDPITGRRRRVKVVAASATVSEPQRQMRNLYQRERTTQFPHPGPNLYTSFYAVPKETSAKAPDAERLAISDTEQRAYAARVYSAMVTNGHRHTVAMASILGQFHLLITELYELLRADDPEREVIARATLVAWLSEGPLQRVHAAALSVATRSQLLTLVDLHRISLTYVTNKKGGDQVIDTERAEFDELHEAAGFAGYMLNTRLISGAVSASEIQDVVREAENRVKEGQEFRALNNTLRSIIATSAVSHGVDVEEFNAMFFAGMPSDIAEYIQASSRIGRTHVGFSLLVPIPQRQRDRFITEIFDIYHRFLERMVLPAAVDRWAEKAIKRVMPSIFQEYICGISRIQETIRAPGARKADVRDMRNTSEVNNYLNDAANRTAVVQFLVEALGLEFKPPVEGLAYYRSMVATELGDYRSKMAGTIASATSLRDFFKNRDRAFQPMTSLRDVDLQGVISESWNDAQGRRVPADATALAMNFIRRGISGELDEEEDEAD